MPETHIYKPMISNDFKNNIKCVNKWLFIETHEKSPFLINRTIYVAPLFFF